MDEAEAERALNREPSSDESDEEALIRVPRRRNNRNSLKFSPY